VTEERPMTKAEVKAKLKEIARKAKVLDNKLLRRLADK
jgi:hypothetical protein